ncbi:transmembrane and coiled-coil domain-containing protein 3-like isoform X2 [Dendronephthya gigantea]|uniref:transmembrane and coiled-coil domain-containing protein 3-like isoform X2 n=1 Tax=Dendronephthya gigantea TaxID=151771 RepID=UPI00106A9A3D|nr:transmembrane and coiled-coil domain-containing protein 3-like isoform X2 [Dendronephthya gigantea]
MHFQLLISAWLTVCLVAVTKSTNPIVDQIKDFKSWQGKSSCKSVSTLFDIQKRFTWQLSRLAGDKNRVKDLLAPQVTTLHLFLRELNDTKYAIFSSFNFLSKLLKEDYKSIQDVKGGIASRITYFQNEIGREQELFNGILKAEKELDAFVKEKEKQNDTTNSHSSKMQKYVEEVLSDVSNAADKLENSLEENAYSKQVGGAYEVVLRMSENEEGDIMDSSENNYSQLLNDQNKYVMTTLIDSGSNYFVLSKPNDPTLPHEDRHLIQNVISIIIVSFLFALVCNIFHMPTMFGFVLAGMILGPTGINVIQSVVQIETLGEFGVFLILFSLGLEFSPDRIKKVWKVAIYGSTFIMVTVVFCGIVWGSFFGIPTQQSSFVAACLCLSSTPLVAKFISSSEKASLDFGGGKHHTNGDDYAGPLLGILIMQDVHLGFLIAILPALAGHHGTRSARVIKSGLVHDLLHGIRHSEETVPAGWLMIELMLALLGVLMFGYLVSKYFLGKFLRYLQSREDGHLELLALGVLAFCFVFLQLTEILGISMELGCFMAGTMISSQGEAVTQKLNILLEPIKDVFSCIFFASIGLHVFPTFLYDQLALITTLTLGVVIIKFVVASSVLRFLMLQPRNVRFIIAAGLAQVSEFSFVLGSRARRLGLITREGEQRKERD